MPTFTGLTGVRRKRVEGVYAETPAAFVRKIRSSRVVSHASDDGSITVWRDDQGCLRGAFCRYLSVLAEEKFESAAAMKRWLIDWLPKCREYHS